VLGLREGAGKESNAEHRPQARPARQAERATEARPEGTRSERSEEWPEKTAKRAEPRPTRRLAAARKNSAEARALREPKASE